MFPSQRAVIWTSCLLTTLTERAAEQSVELPVTRDTIAPMWRQCNGFGKSNDSIQKAICKKSRWRHQMETFSALLAFCAGNSPVTDEFYTQRPVTRSFDVFFDRTWTNNWANNGDAGDLRRHRTHYDGSVMVSKAFDHYMHYNPRFVRSVQVVEIDH